MPWGQYDDGGTLPAQRCRLQGRMHGTTASWAAMCRAQRPGMWPQVHSTKLTLNADRRLYLSLPDSVSRMNASSAVKLEQQWITCFSC